MNKIKQLASQTAVYGLGTIVPRFLNFLLMTPFYTRVFILGEYGIVTELYSYAAFLFVLLTYGMETTFFRYSELEKNKDKTYSTALTSLFTTSSLFILFVLLFSKPLSGLIQYQNNTEYIIYFALIIGIDAFIAIPFAKLRQQNKALKFTLIKIINVIINVSFNFFFLWLCPRIIAQNPDSFITTFYNPEIGVGYAFISNLIATVITLIILLPDIINIHFLFDFSLLKKMLRYAFPLLIVGLAGMVNEVSDKLLFRFLITVPPEIIDGQKYVLSQLGIYGANYKLAVLMTLFIQMFRYAAEPFFFSHAKDKDSKVLYADVMKYFIIFCLIIFLLVMLFLNIFRHFIDEDYWQGLHIVPVILLANLFLGIFFNLSIWYKLNDITRYGAYIALTGAGITILLNIILIPVFGYTGASWTHFFCYLTMVILSFILGRKFFPIPYDLRRIGIYFFLALGIYFINKFVPFPSESIHLVINTIFIIVFALTVYFIERPLFKKSFK